MAEARIVFGRWEPATPREVADLFSALDVPWWIAGGYAIELAVGRSFRTHSDIDVLLLRRHQLAVRQALASWECWAADPPGVLRPWLPVTTLPTTVHDIWCRPDGTKPWRIQVMLDEADKDTWISRRNNQIRRPISSLGHTTPDCLPYLTPEIQLFYKAKEPRPKDNTDFTTALPLLNPTQRQWLADAITSTYDQSHPWLDQLHHAPD